MPTRTNLSVNPRATTATGYTANSGSWTTANNVAAPGGNPDGVTTACRVTVAAGGAGLPVLASIRNIDGLGAGPSRGVGVWVLAPADCTVRMYVDGDQPGTTKTTNAPAGVWTYCTTTAPGSGNLFMIITRVSGNTSAGDLTYVTGSIAEAGTVPASFFDGATPYGAWTGTAGASASTFNPPTLTATLDGLGRVRLDATLPSPPTNLATISDASVSASTTKSSGMTTVPPTGSLNTRASLLTSSTVKSGTVTAAGAYTNGRFALDVRLAGANLIPAKVRGVGGTAPGPWLDLTEEWQTLVYDAGTIATAYGFELAPLSPYSLSASVEVRSWRLRNMLTTYDPSLTRTVDGDTVPVPIPRSTFPGLEEFLDDQALTLYDNTAPLGVPVLYTLTTSKYPTAGIGATITLDEDRPLIARRDVPEPALAADMVLTYGADAVPQQTFHDLVGADAPALVPSAGSTRAGRLGLFVQTWDAGKALLDLLGAGGRHTLRQSTYDGLDMTFGVVRASLNPADPDLDTPPWVVDVEYRELAS